MPVLVVALLDETPNGDTLAAVVFALAALTDGLDGYIARSRDAVTTFGKLMDPIADKLLIAAALISLVSLDRLAAWVAMVIIAREFAVTVLRAIAAEQGVVIPASWLGKVKTVAAGRRRDRPDRRQPGTRLGRRARLRRGRGDRDQRRRLLLRPAPADRGRARSAGASARDRSRAQDSWRSASSHSRIVTWRGGARRVSSSSRRSPRVP